MMVAAVSDDVERGRRVRAQAKLERGWLGKRAGGLP